MELLINHYNKIGDLILILGYFDGFHLGHQELIKSALELKKNTDYQVALFSFVSPPSNKDNAVIANVNQKVRALKELGVDYFLIYDFEMVKNLLPFDFIKDILYKLGVKIVVIGEDYRFGCKASGDVTTLIDYSREFDYKVISKKALTIHDQKISSRTMRYIISSGDISHISIYYGRDYYIDLKVVSYDNHYILTNIYNHLLPPIGTYQVSYNINHIKAHAQLKISKNGIFLLTNFNKAIHLNSLIEIIFLARLGA